MCVVTLLSASHVILTLHGNWYALFSMSLMVLEMIDKCQRVLVCIDDILLGYILDEPFLFFLRGFIVS